MAGEIFKLFGSIFIDDKSATKSLEGVQNKTSDMANNIGKGLNSIGNKMLGFATGVGGAALAMYIPFEETVAKISTLVPDSGMLETIKGDILKTSSELGVSSVALGEAIYQGLSSGVSPEKISDFSRDMAKFAKAGFTEPSKAVDLATTILNSYGLQVEDTGRITDVLITTQNKGKTTIDELSSSMGKVIPTAKSMGVSVEQLGAAYSLMTSKGIATAETTTYLNSMLNELGKSGTKSSEELKKATGKTFQELTEAGVPLGDVLVSLEEHAKASGLSLSDMFGSAEAGKAALVLATNSGNDFNAMLEEMENSTGATEEAFKKVDNTLKSRIMKIIERVKNSFIKLGEASVPLIENVVDKIESFATWLSNLDSQTIQNYASMLKWVGIGGVVLKVLGGLITTISGVTGAFGALGGAAAVAGGATGVGATTLAIGGLTASLPVLAGVLGAGALAFYGIKKATDDTIPSMDTLIGKNSELSQSTKDKILGLESSFDTFNSSLQEHYFNNQVVTEEMANNLIGSYQDITTGIKTNLEEQKQAELSKIEYLRIKSPEIYQDMFEDINNRYGTQGTKIAESEQAISNIISTALAQNRELTQSELNEIDRISQEAQLIGLASTTTNEMEKLAIQQMYDGMTLAEKQEWASQMLTKANELFDAEKQKADEAYNEKVLQIQSSNALSTSQKDEAIRIAREERDNVVNEAKGQKDDIISNVQSQWAEVGSYVNLGTGEVLKWYERFGREGANHYKSVRDESTKTGTEVQRAAKEMASGHKKAEDSTKDLKKETNALADAVNKAPKKLNLDSNFTTQAQWARDLKWDIDNIPSYKNITVNTHNTSSGERIGGSQKFAKGAEGFYNNTNSLALVGEQGPEMVELPRGSKVKTHRETRNTKEDGGMLQAIINLDGRNIMTALVPYFSSSIGENNRKLGFGNV